MLTSISMNEIIQIVLFLVALIIITPVLGRFMAQVYLDEKHTMKPVFSWLENLIYRIGKINKDKEMSWKTYVLSLLTFNLVGFILLFVLLTFQKHLPLNPQKLDGTSWHLALNTAVSFVTNTNWQSYSGESTLGYLVVWPPINRTFI